MAEDIISDGQTLAEALTVDLDVEYVDSESISGDRLRDSFAAMQQAQTVAEMYVVVRSLTEELNSWYGGVGVSLEDEKHPFHAWSHELLTYETRLDNARLAQTE